MTAKLVWNPTKDIAEDGRRECSNPTHPRMVGI